MGNQVTKGLLGDTDDGELDERLTTCSGGDNTFTFEYIVYTHDHDLLAWFNNEKVSPKFDSVDPFSGYDKSSIKVTYKNVKVFDIVNLSDEDTEKVRELVKNYHLFPDQTKIYKKDGEYVIMPWQIRIINIWPESVCDEGFLR